MSAAVLGTAVLRRGSARRFLRGLFLQAPSEAVPPVGPALGKSSAGFRRIGAGSREGTRSADAVDGSLQLRGLPMHKQT